MKSSTKWIVGIVVGIAVLLVVFGVLFLGGSWMGGYGGMMRGPGMMRGGFLPMHGFGWGSMLFAMLIPVSCLFLLIFGAVALANLLTQPRNAPPPPPAPLVAPYPERKCASCGRSAQAEWTTCPYCGQAL